MAQPGVPPLPPTSPAGGPGFAPTGGVLTTADLPTWGGMAQGSALAGQPVTDPNQRAALAGQLFGDTANALQGTNLPTFSPNDPSLVGRVAVPGARPIPQVDPTGSPLAQSWGQHKAQEAFDARTGALTRGPGWVENFTNWIGGNAQSTADLKARSQAADFYGQPQTKQYFSHHPTAVAMAEKDPVGFAVKLGPMLDAAVRGQQAGASGAAVLMHPNGMVKNDSNPDLTAAFAEAHGVPHGTSHAILEPHQYSWPEFHAATKGLTNRQAQQMWEMQHYLNPQQQAVASYLTTLNNQVTAAHPNGGAATDGGAADRQYQQVLHMIATGMPSQ